MNEAIFVSYSMAFTSHMIHNDVHTIRKSVSLFTAVSDAAACKSSGGWHRQIPAFSQIKVRARCSLADQLTLSVKRWAWLQCPFQQGVLCWALERKAGNILTDAMFRNLDEDSALVSGAEDSPVCATHSPALSDSRAMLVLALGQILTCCAGMSSSMDLWWKVPLLATAGVQANSIYWVNGPALGLWADLYQ